jgi:hypothetical protein
VVATDHGILTRFGALFVTPPAAAGLATFGFVLKFLAEIPSLFPSVPQKLHAAIRADQPLVQEIHASPSSSKVGPDLLANISDRRMNRKIFWVKVS